VDSFAFAVWALIVIVTDTISGWGEDSQEASAVFALAEADAIVGQLIALKTSLADAAAFSGIIADSGIANWYGARWPHRRPGAAPQTLRWFFEK
jgi:hypothetical protein